MQEKRGETGGRPSLGLADNDMLIYILGFKFAFLPLNLKHLIYFESFNFRGAITNKVKCVYSFELSNHNHKLGNCCKSSGESLLVYNL